MLLSDVAEVKVNFEDADFWLVRSNSRDLVGQPTRTFSPDYIGIKVTRPDIVISDYLYYGLTHLHNKGVFKLVARGTTNLVHIRVEDVKNVPLRPI